MSDLYFKHYFIYFHKHAVIACISPCFINNASTVHTMRTLLLTLTLYQNETKPEHQIHLIFVSNNIQNVYQ